MTARALLIVPALLLMGQYPDEALIESQSESKSTDVTWAAEELSGTWNVTIKPTGLNTCDRGKPKLRVHQWLLSVNDDRVSVEVLGRNRYFPKLKGRLEKNSGTVELEGEGKKLPKGETVKPTVVYVIEFGENAESFEGQHYFLGVASKPNTCVTFYKVTGTKQ